MIIRKVGSLDFVAIVKVVVNMLVPCEIRPRTLESSYIYIDCLVLFICIVERGHNYYDCVNLFDVRVQQFQEISELVDFSDYSTCAYLVISSA